MQRYIFEEADLKANRDHLSQVGGGGEVFAAGAQVGEREVAGPRQFEAGGYDGGVQIDDGAKLDLQPNLHHAGRKGLAAEQPTSTISQRRGEGGQQTLPLFVAEALDIKELHRSLRSSGRETSAVRLFIGEDGRKRDSRNRETAHGGHVTVESAFRA